MRTANQTPNWIQNPYLMKFNYIQELKKTTIQSVVGKNKMTPRLKRWVEFYGQTMAFERNGKTYLIQLVKVKPRTYDIKGFQSVKSYYAPNIRVNGVWNYEIFIDPTNVFGFYN